MFNNFFRRRKGDINEAQDYLRSTDGVSRTTAILLGITGFLVVFASVFALFLGGQWLYSRLSGDSTETPQEVSLDINQDNGTDSAAGLAALDAVKNIGNTEADADTEGPETTVTSSTSTEDSSVDTIVQEPTIVQTTTDIPNTGPASTLVYVMVVALLGAAAHRKFA